MTDLIETAQSKQKALNLNESQFCRRLGISRIYWKQIKNGERQPGAKFLKGLTQAFPELTLPILEYLAGNGGNHNAKIKSNHKMLSD
jgi:transcriptional regulator with XRE-family HTH domain